MTAPVTVFHPQRQWTPTVIGVTTWRDPAKMRTAQRAEVHRDCPGLAVAPAFHVYKTGHWSWKGWKVYHVESGWGVCGNWSGSKERARKILRELAPLADWSLPKDELLATIDKSAVIAAIKRARGILE